MKIKELINENYKMQNSKPLSSMTNKRLAKTRRKAKDFAAMAFTQSNKTLK